MIPARWFLPLLLVTLFSLPASAAKTPLVIAVDGYAETLGAPPGRDLADSTHVTIVAEIDSVRGVNLGPLVFSIRARDANGHTLLSKERVQSAPLDTTSVRQITWSFRSGPGKVRVQIRAKALNFEGSGDADFQLDVPRFSKEPFPVSTARIGRTDSSGHFQDVPSHQFRSGTDRPMVLLSFGTFTSPDLETAGADSFGSVQVHWVLQRQSKVVKDSTFVAHRAKGPLRFEENPARWGSGPYSFQITLTSPDGSVRRAGEFQVTAGGADLLRDPVLTRTVLGYIATGAERQDIETASADSLPSVWARFWKRRDTTPGTTSNEALDRFLNRVEEATNRFGGVVPGWRSDRGRILIQHGAPDHTERVFDQLTRVATEIWYYDQRNMSYVFQDPEGFGNYKLTGGQ